MNITKNIVFNVIYSLPYISLKVLNDELQHIQLKNKFTCVLEDYKMLIHAVTRNSEHINSQNGILKSIYVKFMQNKYILYIS